MTQQQGIPTAINLGQSMNLAGGIPMGQIPVVSSTQTPVAGPQSKLTPAVANLVRNVDPLNPVHSLEFASQTSSNVDSITDRLLPLVRARDLDEKIGSQLSDIVVLTKSVNLTDLGGKKSRVPLIGRWIDAARMKKEQIVSNNFDNVAQQVDKVLGEVTYGKRELVGRIQTAHELATQYGNCFTNMEDEITAVKVIMEDISNRIRDAKAEIEAIAGAPENAENVRKTLHLRELTEAYSRWDVKRDMLLKIQQSAYNSRLMADATRASFEVLVDQFHTIEQFVIPEWRKQLGMMILGGDAAKKANLAKDIHDFTQEIMIRNAEQVKDTMITVTQTSQRGMIDVATLQKQQQLFIEGITESARIVMESTRTRANTEGELLQMREQMKRVVLDTSQQLQDVQQQAALTRSNGRY